MPQFVKLPFYGPNWRSEYALLELMFRLSSEEKQFYAQRGEELCRQLHGLLKRSGVHERHLQHFNRAVPPQPEAQLARLLFASGIALQRHAGHDVHRVEFLPPRGGSWFRAQFEMEDDHAGIVAWRISIKLMQIVVRPGQEFSNGADLIDTYRSRFSATVLPLDTRAIIAAARRAGVPWIKLDRSPFRLQDNRGRLRINGGLLLGQGVHRHIVDGTICRDRNHEAFRLCRSPARIARYLADFEPVLPLGVSDPGDCPPLPEAPEHNRTTANFESWTLIVANHRAAALIDNSGSEREIGRVHASTLEIAGLISRDLDVGILAVSIQSREPGLPLQENGGFVTGIDPAPELDSLLHPNSAAWKTLADGFIGWLFPDGAPSRIPIVAVTGTNGKTTTCRMIEHIARHSGLRTGLSCSEGLYLDGRMVRGREDKRITAMRRHLTVSNKNIELAAMEYYIAFLKREGFAFDHCDVGILTNVTEDHLQPGWENVEMIAEIKRSVLERARKGVVVNADDPSTASVLPHVSARRVAMTSVTKSRVEIRDLFEPDCYCLLEPIDGEERIMIHDGDRRIDLMGVARIPATFEGTARFNVENALQAIAACYLLGFGPAQIKDAMAAFSMSFEATPGRLNIYDGLPFRVIMDYAHNGDGFDKLGAFVDQQDVAGRKILLFAVSTDRMDKEIFLTTRAAAGHFDHYICRNYPRLRNPERDHIADTMRDILEKEGVDPAQISVCKDGEKAVDLALGMGRKGDLLVMSCGLAEMNEMWSRIKAFSSNP